MMLERLFKRKLNYYARKVSGLEDVLTTRKMLSP